MEMVAEDDSGTRALVEALAAVSLHTVAMLLVMGIIAIVVYRWIGVGILRRAWFNLDLVWATTGTLHNPWSEVPEQVFALVAGVGLDEGPGA